MKLIEEYIGNKDNHNVLPEVSDLTAIIQRIYHECVRSEDYRIFDFEFRVKPRSEDDEIPSWDFSLDVLYKSSVISRYKIRPGYDDGSYFRPNIGYCIRLYGIIIDKQANNDFIFYAKLTQ